MADNRMYIVNHCDESYIAVGKSYGCDWTFDCDQLLTSFFQYYSIYGRFDDIAIVFEADDEFDMIVKEYECYNDIFYKQNKPK